MVNYIQETLHPVNIQIKFILNLISALKEAINNRLLHWSISGLQKILEQSKSIFPQATQRRPWNYSTTKNTCKDTRTQSTLFASNKKGTF